MFPVSVIGAFAGWCGEGIYHSRILMHSKLNRHLTGSCRGINVRFIKDSLISVKNVGIFGRVRLNLLRCPCFLRNCNFKKPYLPVIVMRGVYL